jgi:acetoin utilization deacetylase AcuC-like enzyme
MRAYHTDTFTFPKFATRNIPTDKYPLLRAAVQHAQIATLAIADAATSTQLLRAHDADYIDRFLHGRMTDAEMQRINFPYSPQLVERACRTVGATIAACRSTFVDAVSVSLDGGTHHACRAHGEGFCCLNDSVIAARAVQAEGRAQRIAIVDCDVHQGNGTADCAHGDHSIFTFSIHAENNYPFHKIPSTLDIALPDDTSDDAYMAALIPALERILTQFRPDLVIYLAGADPFEGDRLGRLSLTIQGLAARDAFVLKSCRALHIPIAVTMAGGYAPNIADTVNIHLQTVHLCAQYATPPQ